MSRRPLLVALLCCAPFLTAVAQRRGGGDQGDRFREPSWWISGSWGVQWGYTVSDGTSSSTWAFSEGYPVRLSVERGIGGGQSVGAFFSNGRLPLRYFGSGSNACVACDAHATMSTFGVVLHSFNGRRTGFSSVYDISVGATQFGQFDNDAGGAALPPTKKNIDFMLGLGGGVGFAFAPDWVVELVHEYTYGFHERANLPGNAPSSYRHNRTRVGLRVGL